MESTNLDMDEIFDDHDGDGDVGAMQSQDDVPDNTQDPSQLDNEDDAEKAEVLERLQKLSKGAAKKVVRRPQPKLDPTRLTGERGIPILPKLFENVKFKGRGHEAADLATIMRHMEHWGHRLFPRMPFDEVIERVEKLGSKKPVQTVVKKIRLDMPILDEDFVGSDPDNDDRAEEDVARNMDIDDLPQEPVAAEDVWDEMLRESEEVQATQERETQSAADRLANTNSEQTNSSGDTQGAGMTGEPELIATRIDTPTTPVSKEKPSESGGLTPDQIARIERNKQLALERRMKKMGQLTPKPPNT